MKKTLILGCLLAVMAAGEEKTTTEGPAQSYLPADVKVVGDLAYGQTSHALPWTSKPYTAFVFYGNSGDKIDVTVKSADGKALVAVADSSLGSFGSAAEHLSIAIPQRGPDTEVFYILVHETGSKPFTVQLRKVSE